MKKFMVVMVLIVGIISANDRKRECALVVQPAVNPVKREKIEFVLIIPSYNNKKWYERNLESVFMQKYPHYRVIYLDDCSTDGTGDLVDAYVRDVGMRDRVIVIHNKERMRAMANIYKAVHMCHDREIVVMLDGDDFFASDTVLDTLARVYANPDIWITYGSFMWQVGGKQKAGWAADIPKNIVQKNAFRFYPTVPAHLRTFYAKLFKKIKREDLCENGVFYEYTYDLAMMFPMMEMAGQHFKFIPKFLYIYNDENEINDHKTGKIKQRMTDLRIRTKPPYSPIDRLFEDGVCA